MLVFLSFCLEVYFRRNTSDGLSIEKRKHNADYGVYIRKLYREYDCHGNILIKSLSIREKNVRQLKKSKMYLRNSHLSLKNLLKNLQNNSVNR